MGKIGDLFVRLGLKSDDFKKGIKDAKKETQGFGKTLSNMKAGALAVWAAIGTSVIKFAQDFIKSTNRIGDAWATFTSESKAMWGTFLDSLSSWDFKDFFSRMQQAAAGAASFAKALDSEFEVGNSIKLQRAAMEGELAALKVISQDATKSYDDRIKAAQAYLDKISPIYEQIEAQAKRMEDAHLEKWLTGAGLADTEQTRQDLHKFLVEIGKFPEIYDKLQQYSEAQRIIDRGANALGSNYVKLNKAYTDRALVAKDIEEFAKGYGTDILKLFRAYNDMSGDEDTAPLIQAITAAGEAAGAKDRQTNEIQTLINSLLKQKANEEASKTALADMSGIFKAAETSLKDFEQLLKTEGDEIDRMIAEDYNWELELDTDEAHQKMLEFMKDYKAVIIDVDEMNRMLENSIVSAVSGGIQALSDLAFGLDGASWENVLAAFIQPLADTMRQMGEMFMAEGIAMTAFKNSIKNPAALIAAGAALIAVSSVVTSGLNKLVGNPAGGTAASTGAGSTSAGGIETYEQEITVHVVGEISGNNIVLAGQKTLNKWSR